MKVPHAKFSYSQYWDGTLPEDHPDIIALLKDVSEEYGDQAADTNADFFEALKEIVNSEGKYAPFFAYDSVQQKIEQTPRYAFMKRRKLGDKWYEVTVDILSRRVSLGHGTDKPVY